MSETQTTSTEAETQLSSAPVFTQAEEAWLTAVAQTYKVPLSAEQYDVVRGFFRSTPSELRGAA